MLGHLLSLALLTAAVAWSEAPAAANARAGVRLFRSGQVQEAIPMLKAAVEGGSAADEALYYLVRAYRVLRLTGPASYAAEKLLRQFPGSAYTHKLLGEAYDAQYQDLDAEREFRTAIQLSGDIPELHFALGLILWRRHDDDGAAAEFRKELKISPAFPRTAVYLAEIAVRQNDPRTAIAYLKTALALDPAQYDALCQLAKCAESLNENDEAIRALQRAIELEPHNPTAHYRLSRILRRAGRVKEAEREEAATRANTDSARFPATTR